MASETGVKSFYQLSFFWFAMIVCGLPLFASIFCVLWSLLFNFEATTRTHCRVPNYLPSMSAAIGVFSPQKYVWRVCIGLHSTPRFMLAFAYYSYHTSLHIGRDNELYKTFAALNSFAHIVEIGGLVGLTYISSSENHDIHELCFIFFMAGAIVYMSLTIFLMSWGRSCNGRIMTFEELSSVKWKKRIFGFNLLIFLLSVYLYFRHNRYCESGIYSLFAVCEYSVIASNILYHGTAIYDFGTYSLAFALSSLLQLQPPSPSKYSSLPQQKPKTT